jgi:hypothetical protein
VLAVMLVAIVFLSIVSFVAIIVGTATGLERGDFQNGLWPVISFLPLIGLPIAFLMVLTLLIVGFTRRGRENRASAASGSGAATPAAGRPAAASTARRTPGGSTRPRSSR